MSQCGSQAVLMITTSPEGTTTNVVRRRIELRCELDQGHSGRHRDDSKGEEWERAAAGSRPPTLLRQEDDDG
ncbi:MAG TPA: hypothetical protein VK550_24220 [Polyangiaceae bacterium]|nr:hypothetical protein [Polyangiaceae bacterium]